MPNVILTTAPSEYDIKPLNPIIYEFNSDNSGAPAKPYSVFYFSANALTLPYTTAIEGDFIEVNGQKIYFRDNPNATELTVTSLSTLYDSTLELFQILSENPTLKNTYDFAIVDDGGGFYHVIMISKTYTSLNEITVNLGGTITNFYHFESPGNSGFRGGDLINWGVYVNLYTLLNEEKRMLNDSIPISGFIADSEKIVLQKDWQGLNPDLSEKTIDFDFSDFLSLFVESVNPFNNSNFQAVKEAIVRYYIDYGEYYGTNQRKFPIDDFGIDFPLYAHISQLSTLLKPNSTVISTFAKYWNRTETLGVFPILSQTKVSWLNLVPNSHKIDVNQLFYGAFIYRYYRFDQTETIGTYQDTEIHLEYDLYFENGLSSVNNVLPLSTQTITYFTQYYVNLSPSRIDLITAENFVSSKIEKIVWRVVEYNPVLAITRVLTEDLEMKLNNELRNYKVNQGCQIIFLNSLGCFDSVYIHNEIVRNINTNYDIYSKNIDYDNETTDLVDNEVLIQDTNQVFRLSTDLLNREIYNYLGNELLKSKKIYLKIDYQGFNGRVGIIESDFSDSDLVDMKTLSITFQPLKD